MLDPANDADDDLYLKKSGIDRSVGFLIGGVFVLLFFLLTMVEMGRIQHMSDEVAAPDRFAPEEQPTEIGDVEGATRN